MSHDIATTTVCSGPALPSDADILDAWLAGRNQRTIRAYRFDLADFARFVGAAGPGQAIEAILSMSHGSANRVALAYRASLMDRGLSSATIARRIAALRSMVRLARQLGRVSWSLDVESPKVTKYRDTTGPGLDGWRAIRATARGATTKQGKRDLALVLLLHDSCLRRGECVGLDLCHVDLGLSRVSIIGKGRTDREWITVSPQASAALAEWMAIRGDHSGPLFCRLDRSSSGVGRLGGESVNRMVNKIGRRAGLTRKVKAHGLRHHGITRVLDLTNGNIRAAQAIGRHVDVRTTMAYDDNRTDYAGQLAAMLGADE